MTLMRIDLLGYTGTLLVALVVGLIAGEQNARAQHVGTEPDKQVLAEWYSPRNPYAAFELNGTVVAHPENNEMYFWNYCPATATWRLIPSMYAPDPCYDGDNTHLTDLAFGAGTGLDSGSGGLAISGLGRKKKKWFDTAVEGPAAVTPNNLLAATGVRVEDVEDLVVSLPGDDFELTRHYQNAMRIGGDGSFGPATAGGWTFSVDTRIVRGAWQQGPPNTYDHSGTAIPFNGTPKFGENGLLILATAPNRHTTIFHNLDQPPEQSDVFRPLGPGTQRIVAINDWADTNITEVPQAIHDPIIHDVWAYSDGAGGGTTVFFRPDDSHEISPARKDQLAGRIWQQIDEFGNTWTYEYTWIAVPGRVHVPSGAPLELPRLSNIWLHGRYPGDPHTKARISFRWDLTPTGQPGAPAGTGQVKAVILQRPYQASDGVRWITDKIVNYTYRKDFIYEWLLLHPPETGTVGTPGWPHLGHVESLVRVDSRTVVNMPVQGGDPVVPKTLKIGMLKADSVLWTTVLYRYQFYTERPGTESCALRGIVLPAGLDQISDDVLNEYPGWSDIPIADRPAFERDVKAFQLMSANDNDLIPIWSGTENYTATPKQLSERWISCISSGDHSGRVSEELFLRERFHDPYDYSPYLAHSRRVTYRYARRDTSGIDRVLAPPDSDNGGGAVFATLFRYTVEERAFDYDPGIADYDLNKVTRHISQDRLLYAIQQDIKNSNPLGKRYFTRCVPFTIATIVAEPDEVESGFATRVWCTRTFYDDYNRRIKTLPPSRVTGAVVPMSESGETNAQWFALNLANATIGAGSTAAEETEYVDAPGAGPWQVLCNMPCSTLVKKLWRDIGPSAQSPGRQLISETVYTDNYQNPADPLRCQLPLQTITARQYLDANVNSSEACAAPNLVENYQYKLCQSGWLDSRLIRPIETITRTQALDAAPFGPGGEAEEIVGVDKTGEVAWRKHADGSFEYFDYDARTGMPTLLVSGSSPSRMNAVFALQVGNARTLAWITARHPTASTWGAGATPETELVSERLYNLTGSLVRSSGPQRIWTDYIYGTTAQRHVVVATIPPLLASGIDGSDRFAGLTTIAYYNAAMNPYRVYSFSGAAVDRDSSTGHALECRIEADHLISDRSCTYKNNGLWLAIDRTETGQNDASNPTVSRELSYAYDNEGNLISETSADGDRTIYERNVMGSLVRTRIRNAITEYILDQYESSPVGSPTFANGLGDGRPTFVLEYRANNSSSGNAPSDPVISRRFYDNWGRGTAECHVGSANPFGPSIDPVSVRRFDAAGNILEQGLFPAGSSPTAAAADPNLWLSSAAGNVTRSRYGLNGAKNEYLLRVVAGSTEASTTSLSTRYFYDASGRQIAQQSPGSTLKRTLFDIAGRVTKSFECRPTISIEGAAATYAQIADPSSLVVLAETEYKYAEHASDHPVTGSRGTPLQCVQINRRRADSDPPSEATSSAPPLGSAPVTTYQLTGFDSAGRTLASISLGSLATSSSSKVADSILGQSTAAMPACPPYPLFDLGDDVFDLYTDADGGGIFDLHTGGGSATRFRYRDDGQLTDTVEYLSPNDRRVTHRISDGFGRETYIIDNYDPETIKIAITGDPSYSIGGIGRVRFSPNSAPNANRVHYREYENDHLSQEGVCWLEGGTVARSQLTKYEYGFSEVGGISSSDGARQHIRTIYPSPTTGKPVRAIDHPIDGITGGEVSFRYNLRGDMVIVTDQNGTVKQLDYDAAGRSIRELISAPASGVSTNTLSLRTQYDSFGRVAARFSDADPNTPATTADVTYQYNEVGDVVEMTQGGGARAYLGIYELPGSGGTTAGDVHRHTLTKFGLVATGDASSTCGISRAAHHLSYEPLTAALSVASRVSAVNFGLPGAACGMPNAGSVHYTRMGGGQVAVTDLPAIDMQLDRTVNAAGQRRWGVNDSAPAGQFGGWDGFGRLVRNTWMKSTGPLWQELYAYDDLARRVSSDQTVSTARFADRDWRLSYDRLDHLTDAQVGRVNDGVFANLPGVSHRWAVDALGNFTSIKTDLDGDGDFTSGDASQTRTHNLQNELTQADGNHLSYDANGNLTVISTEADGGGTIIRRFTYDAWNRLVRVEIPAEQKVVTYTYNALHWRVGESVYLDGNLTTPVETHKFYYAPDWRLLEEETSVASGSGATTTWTTSSTQFYYGVRSLDDVLLVAHDANNDGDLNDATDCAWYQLTDSRFSPVLTVDAKADPGRVLQQIVYGAYGKFAASTPADFNGDGFQDYTDFDDFSAAFAAGAPSADFNGDGFLEFTDFDDFVSAFEATHPAVAMLPPRIGFGGYQFDPHTGYLLARNRWFDPGLSRWLTRDPAGYVDGMNLYLYVRANPMTLIDPMGLAPPGVLDYIMGFGMNLGNWGESSSQNLPPSEELLRAQRQAVDTDPTSDASIDREINRQAAVGKTFAGIASGAATTLDVSLRTVFATGDALDSIGQAIDSPTWSNAAMAALTLLPGVNKVEAQAAKRSIETLRSEFRANLGHSIGRVLKSDEAAHHMVQLTSNRFADMRAKLESFGLGVNDPAVNGAVVKGEVHSRMHTKAYAKYMNESFARIDNADDAKGFLQSTRSTLEAAKTVDDLPWEKAAKKAK